MLKKNDSKLCLFASELDSNEGARREGLTIFVVGASGDLAKKKTYPSLFELFRNNFLSRHTLICGYARSAKSTQDFRRSILPYLKHGTPEDKEAFLSICIYRSGQYDSAADVRRVFGELKEVEAGWGCHKTNRLFYFAIPPTVFVPIGKSLKEAVIGNAHEDPTLGWQRLILEKPFGRDSESFRELSSAMSELYTEDYSESKD